MKITKLALMVACIMALSSSAWNAFCAVGEEQRLRSWLAPLMEEGLDKLQANQEHVGFFHWRMCIDLARSAYYLMLAGLLIFALRRLRISN